QLFTVGDARPGRRRNRPRGVDDFDHFVHYSAAMQGQVAAGVEGAPCAFRERAVERSHRDVVGQQYAFEPDLTADNGVDQVPGKGRGSRVVDRREDDMRGHRPWHRCQRSEWLEVALREAPPIGLYARTGAVAV